MADNKDGREEQAQHEKQRQRQREIAAELERGEEPEPPVEPETLAAFEVDLDAVAFPATGTEIVEAVGGYENDTSSHSYAVDELLPETEDSFDAPADVRAWVQRPTVAGAMKQIAEASAGLPDAGPSGSQYSAYERTFEELEAIDTVDDDEGIEVVADWIVERIETRGKLPGSRDVRREAAKVCRASGYEVRNDEWLGV